MMLILEQENNSGNTSFKIVKTVESEKVCITAVPELWESSGILFWPRTTKIDKLRCNKNSAPESSWLRIENCVVKRSGIGSFREALTLENDFADLTDTDSEQIFLTRQPNRKKRLEGDLQNYNCRFTELDDNNMFACSGSSASMAETNEQNTQNLEVRIPTPNESVLLIAMPYLDDMYQDYVKGIRENAAAYYFRKFKHQKWLGKLNVKTDKILDMFSKICESIGPSNQTREVSEDILENISFPLGTEEQVRQLEDALQDKNIESILVNKFKILLGTSGTGNYKKVCYLLLDKLFSRDVLMEYTWTAKSKTEAKQSFQSLRNINHLFFKFFLQLIINIQRN